jgi:apolipoprotein N-acyltransferase
VCYDCDYEDVCRRMTSAGAECFVVPIMDAAHWGLKQHLQHAELFRIRAAENGRGFFVQSTSGISQIIDPKGRVIAMAEPFTLARLEGNIDLRTELTRYTQWGWRFPWVASGFGLIALLLAIVQQLQRPAFPPQMLAPDART